MFFRKHKKEKLQNEKTDEKMDEFAPYYTKIANSINETIPVEWYEAYLYGEELGDNQTAMIYFKTAKDGEYISSGKIPDIYNVELKIYFDMISRIINLIKELKKEFIRKGLPEWKIISFYLDKDFKFRIEYGYDCDEEATDSDRRGYWAYKKLGIMPQDDYAKSNLEKYIKKMERKN